MLTCPNCGKIDAAWVFRDLGRDSEFCGAVLDTNPIESPWVEAARTIAGGDLVRAADIIEEGGHIAGAGYARFRAAEALAAAGQEAESAAQREHANAFRAKVGAAWGDRDTERAAGVEDRRGSSQR